MLFNVEIDIGEKIIGYLVPDSFSGRAEIVVTRGEEELLRKPTSDPRGALVTAGRHESGLCGFEIDETMIPGLNGIEELEIRDAESGIIIFRRRRPERLVHQKMFRLETQLLPLLRLDQAMQGHFQFYFPSIERYGLETTHQMFLMNGTESVFASGRMSHKSIEYYLGQGYKTIALIRDPFEELAERVLVLRQIAETDRNFLGMRDAVLFEAATLFSCELQLEQDKNLKRAFKHITPEVAAVLGDPLVRQLTTRLPDEPVTVSSVSAALDVLASFETVGLRSQPNTFLEAVAEGLLISLEEFPSIDPIPVTRELALRLKACPPVEALLEHDLLLYDQIRTAFEKSGSEG